MRKLPPRLKVNRPDVERVRQRFVEGGLPRALDDRQRPGARRKLTGPQEARVIAESAVRPRRGMRTGACGC